MSQNKDAPKSRRRLFRRFLVPEESITLRVIFDNIKNYAVCAAILAAISLIIDKTTPITEISVTKLGSIGTIAFLSLWLILILLCILQSVEIHSVASRKFHERINVNSRSSEGQIKAFFVFMAKAVILLIGATTLAIIISAGVALGLLLSTSIESVVIGGNRGQTTIIRLLPRWTMHDGMPERLAHDRRDIGPLQLMPRVSYKNNSDLFPIIRLAKVMKF